MPGKQFCQSFYYDPKLLDADALFPDLIEILGPLD